MHFLAAFQDEAVSLYRSSADPFPTGACGANAMSCGGYHGNHSAAYEYAKIKNQERSGSAGLFADTSDGSETQT